MKGDKIIGSIAIIQDVEEYAGKYGDEIKMQYEPVFVGKKFEPINVDIAKY